MTVYGGWGGVVQLILNKESQKQARDTRRKRREDTDDSTHRIIDRILRNGVLLAFA